MKITFLRKVQEYDDVYSFFFDGAGVRYDAGSHTHLRVTGTGNLFGSVRELSFASCPGAPELMFRMHVGSGTPFKQKLMHLQAGEQVGLFATRRNIRLPQQPTGSLVFIAGGVGMTPFRSMILEAPKNRNHELTLIQVQRGPHLYRNILEPRLSEYYPALPDNFLETVEAIANHRKDRAQYYICGSPRLVSDTKNTLRHLAVPTSNIHVETFK